MIDAFGRLRNLAALATLGLCALPAGCALPQENELGAGALDVRFTPDPAKQAASPNLAPIVAGIDTGSMPIEPGSIALQFMFRQADHFSFLLSSYALPATDPSRIPLSSYSLREWTQGRWSPLEFEWGLEGFEFDAPRDGTYLLQIYSNGGTLSTSCTAGSTGFWSSPASSCGACEGDPGVCQRVDPGSTLVCGQQGRSLEAGYFCTYPDETWVDDDFALAPGPYSLQGKVLRRDGGPVAGLEVRIGSSVVQTDPSGNYRLDRLPSGVMIVEVRSPTEMRGTILRAPVWAAGTVQDLTMD